MQVQVQEKVKEEIRRAILANDLDRAERLVMAAGEALGRLQQVQLLEAIEQVKMAQWGVKPNVPEEQARLLSLAQKL